MPVRSRYQRPLEPSVTAEAAERAATPLRPKLVAASSRLPRSSRTQKLAVAAITSPNDTSQKKNRYASPPASSPAPERCSRSNAWSATWAYGSRCARSNPRCPSARAASTRAWVRLGGGDLFVATRRRSLAATGPLLVLGELPPAVRHQPVDHEHVKPDDRERPDRIPACSRELRNGVEERHGHTEPAGKLVAGPDADCGQDLHGPEDQEDPAPRMEVVEHHIAVVGEDARVVERGDAVDHVHTAGERDHHSREQHPALAGSAPAAVLVSHVRLGLPARGSSICDRRCH